MEARWFQEGVHKQKRSLEDIEKMDWKRKGEAVAGTAFMLTAEAMRVV